jgi:anaerobic selenocysteine-containing dehydrogenase
MAPKDTAITTALQLVNHSGRGIVVIQQAISLALVTGLVKTFGLDLEAVRKHHQATEKASTNEVFLLL